MNKIHKLVWNARTNGYVVASEAASSRGRAPSELRVVAAVAAGLAGAFLSAGQAWAIPACQPSPSTAISTNITSTFTTACANDSITVSATIDVAGGVGLTNDDGGNTLGLNSLTITSAGAVRGQDPIKLSSATISGGITNSGTIASYWSGGGSGFGGIALSLDSMTVSGDIINTATGSIDGDYGAIRLSGTTAAKLINSGTINSLSNAIVVNGESTVQEIRNEASGTIHGNNNAGISVNSGGTVVALIDNRGTISSSNTGIELYNDSAVTKLVNAAGASITGQHAIEIGGRSSIGDIENFGRLEGSAEGLRLQEGFVTGTVANKATGVIIGGDAGVALGTYNQPSDLHALINEGLIEGGTYGIDGHEGSVISAGITNSGTIKGGSYGIRLTEESSVTGGIVNAGTIEGDRYAIRIRSGSALDRIDITGTQAALLGDVDAPTADLNIKSGAQFSTTNAFSVRSFTVESGAALTLTGAQHTANGLGTDGVTIDQGFFNRGTVRLGAATQGLVNGHYTQDVGGVLEVAVDSVASHGALVVSGDANLAQGTTLKVALGNGAAFNPGDRVQGVVTAGGTLDAGENPATGLLVRDNSVLYKFVADTSRDAQALDLLVARDEAPFVNAVGPNRNSVAGVAATLDDLLINGVPTDLQPVFDRLTALSADELPAAMAQLVPSLSGASEQAGVNALRSMNKIIQSRMESNQGLSAGNAASERYLWVRAFGTQGDQNSQGDVAGFKATTGGIVLGGDAPVNDKLRTGLAFTYARTDIGSRGNGAPSNLDVDTYELVHYGSYNLDPRTDINYQVDIGRNDVKGIRQILFMSQQAQSDFSSLNLHGSVGVGRTWSVSPRSSVTPSVRVDYTHLKTKGYTETGAGALNLNVDGSTFEEFMLTADMKGSHNLTDHTKLVGNASAGYDFINDQSSTASSFVGGGPVFEAKGLKTSPWLYRAGLGLLHDTSGMEYSLRYDLERRTSGYTNQTVSARVRWAF